MRNEPRFESLLRSKGPADVLLQEAGPGSEGKPGPRACPSRPFRGHTTVFRRLTISPWSLFSVRVLSAESHRSWPLQSDWVPSLDFLPAWEAGGSRSPMFGNVRVR